MGDCRIFDEVPKAARAVEVAFKNLGFLGFLKKPKKPQKSKF